MTRYSDAALLKGDYAHLAAQLRTGERTAPRQSDWEKTACDNQAEAAAQEVAKHIFAVQQSLDAEKEQLEIITFSGAGQMKVIAIHPGDGDILRVDGILVGKDEPVSQIMHASQLALTFLRAPLASGDDNKDEGLKIGFVIFDELKERQKARYSKGRKKAAKIDLTKPFGLPPLPRPVPEGDRSAPKKTTTRKTTKKA